MPFKMLTRKNPYLAVMVGHIAFPQIDGSRVPATYSRILIEELLRGKMKFQGLVITDDIEMGGAGVVTQVGERAVKAIEAGVDMVMVAWSKRVQQTVFEALASAVKSHRISEERINRSVERILKIKERFAKDRNIEKPNIKNLRAEIKKLPFRKLTTEIVVRNFSKSAKQKRNQKTVGPETSVLIVSPYRSFPYSFQKRRKKNVSVYRMKGKDLGEAFEQMRQDPKAILVIYVTGKRSARIANRFVRKFNQRIMIVNTEVPGLIQKPERSFVFVNVFTRHPDLGYFTAKEFFTRSL